MVGAAAALLLALPWLVPPQRLPQPGALPWLFSLACLAALWLLLRPRLPHRAVALLLVAMGLGLLPVYTAGDGQWLALVASCLLIGGSAWLVRTAVARFSATTVAEGVAAAWLGAALLSACIGMAQYFNVEQHFWFMSEAPGREPFGNLRQRNHYATLLALGLAAVLWLAARAPQGRRGALGAWCAALGLTAALAVSGSRTGLLQLLALLALAGWWWARKTSGWLRGLLLAIPLVYAAAGWALPWLAGLDPQHSGIWSRFQGGGSDCATRWTLWRDAWQLALQRPWAGWGWGELDYAHFITPLAQARHCELIDNAHNLVLQLAVELGWPLTLTLLAIAIGLAWRRRAGLGEDAGRQLGAAALLLILLHSLLEYPLWYGPFQMAAGLGLGLWWGGALPAAWARPTRAALGWAAALLLAASLAGWDYLRVSQVFLPPAHRLALWRDDALQQARASLFFGPQARFAELSLTPLTPQTAPRVHALALQALHYSPEPAVVEKLIASARMLGLHEEAQRYEALYRIAYPQAWARHRLASGAAAGTEDGH